MTNSVQSHSSCLAGGHWYGSYTTQLAAGALVCSFGVVRLPACTAEMGEMPGWLRLPAWTAERGPGLTTGVCICALVQRILAICVQTHVGSMHWQCTVAAAPSSMLGPECVGNAYQYMPLQLCWVRCMLTKQFKHTATKALRLEQHNPSSRCFTLVSSSLDTKSLFCQRTSNATPFTSTHLGPIRTMPCVFVVSYLPSQ